MGKILTIAINKGGAGKTTAAIHLAHRAADQGFKTLLIDLDSQGNASSSLGGDPGPTITASQLFGHVEITAPLRRVSDTLALIPSDAALIDIERAPLESADTFKANLEQLALRYDLIVIDTPPTMGFGMLAPLWASDFALAPVVPDAYSVPGVQALFMRIEQIRKTKNPKLRFLGVLVNKWQRRNAAQTAVVSSLHESLKRYIAPHSLADLVPIANAAYDHKPVWRGARSGAERRAGKAVRDVMDWVLAQTCPANTTTSAGAEAR